LPASGALLGYPDTGKARTVRVRIKDCSRVPKGSHGNRRREGSEMGGRIDDDLREANLGEATARYILQYVTFSEYLNGSKCF
jgi:hypothetical protein